VQPEIVFAPGPGAFEGQRDDLLAAALERLRGDHNVKPGAKSDN
jgi:hypothetical protein